MKLERTFNVKYEKCLYDLRDIKITLLESLIDVIRYSNNHGYPIRITRVVDEKIPGLSVSDSHAEGRAIDIVVEAPEEKLLEMEAYFNVKFYNIAAISLSDGTPRFIVYKHKGTGKHFHLQIRPGV